MHFAHFPVIWEIIGEDFIFLFDLANLYKNKILTNKRCFTVYVTITVIYSPLWHIYW